MDYKNGKIYKITDNAYTKMYIGSTTQPLSKRFSKHKIDYKQWKDNKCNKIMIFEIFDEFGVENCKIELIEEYECENRSQLERKEGEHIKNNECINKYIAGRTHKEYVQDNKERIDEYKKEWYEQNINRLTAYKKDWYEQNKNRILEKINCECGSSYVKCCESRHNKSKKHINHLNLQE